MASMRERLTNYSGQEHQKTWEDAEDVIVSVPVNKATDDELLELYAIYREMGGDPLAPYEDMIARRQQVEGRAAEQE